MGYPIKAKVSSTPFLTASGEVSPLKSDETGALIVQGGSGKYYEAVDAGEVFILANQAPVAVTAALATTYTGLVVMNPAASETNAVMLGFGYGSDSAISAATTIGYMTGSMTAVTSTLTARNRKLGGAATVMHGEDSCTIGTPVLEAALSYGFTAADITTTLGGINWLDLDGSLIVPPGYFIAAYSTAAITAAMVFSFMWREVAE